MAPVNGFVEIGVAALALFGQRESGDQHVVECFPDGLLVAVVDGIGHGEEAAIVAKAAVATLQEKAQEPVITIVRLCHQALHMTRGATMSLASFDTRSGTMSWLGVGNVFGVLVRAAGAGPDPVTESLLLRPGVVGSQLPPLQEAILPVSPGDTLVLATDGLDPNFGAPTVLSGPPQSTADRLLAQHSKGTDDALVVVARYGRNS